MFSSTEAKVFDMSDRNYQSATKSARSSHKSSRDQSALEEQEEVSQSISSVAKTPISWKSDPLLLSDPSSVVPVPRILTRVDNRNPVH